MHHSCTISGRQQPQEPCASTSSPSPSLMERGLGGEARYNRYKPAWKDTGTQKIAKIMPVQTINAKSSPPAPPAAQQPPQSAHSHPVRPVSTPACPILG